MARERKLPVIRQLPSGSYNIQVYVGKDENGKRKVESYTDPDYNKVVLWALEMQKKPRAIPGRSHLGKASRRLYG